MEEVLNQLSTFLQRLHLSVVSNCKLPCCGQAGVYHMQSATIIMATAKPGQLPLSRLTSSLMLTVAVTLCISQEQSEL